MDLLAVMFIMFIVVPILAALCIPITTLFYVIGILIILGGLLFSIDSKYKGAIITTCLIVGIILLGTSKNSLLAKCPPFCSNFCL